MSDFLFTGGFQPAVTFNVITDIKSFCQKFHELCRRLKIKWARSGKSVLDAATFEQPTVEEISDRVSSTINVLASTYPGFDDPDMYYAAYSSGIKVVGILTKDLKILGVAVYVDLDNLLQRGAKE